MKYIYLLLILSAYCQAQVGINTKNPLHPLSVGSNTNDNAVVFTANGNLGINSSQPQARLEVDGKIKIVDGTQGLNKILTSDANGFASWGDVISPSSELKVSVGIFNTGLTYNPVTATTGKYTGASIVLGPGNWLVRFALELVPNSTLTLADWVTFPVSLTNVAGIANADFTSSNITTDFVVNKRNFINYQGPTAGSGTNQKVLKSMGEFIIKNSTTGNKTYYLVVEKFNRKSTSNSQNIEFQSFASNAILENYLIGIPVNIN